MPGPVPGIHVFLCVETKTWMAGTSPAMTEKWWSFRGGALFGAFRNDGVDVVAFTPHPCSVSRPDGRSRTSRKAAREESPGSIDIRCRITSGGVFPRKRDDFRESATENEPPREARRGKRGKGEKVR